ncbi:MAG: SCO family protein [Kofleriaceae bacterium]|nr:SCO family protein [Kofleriaceae bacterium]
MKYLILLAATVACNRAPVIDTAHVAPPPNEAERVAPPSVTRAAPGEPSLYGIDVGIVDDRGAHVKLDVGRGHPTLISMFYGSCSVACPALLGELKQVAALSPPETRIVLVSFDAARDTPERLRELMATYKLDDRWTLAAANDADARALAAVLGIKYRRTQAGEFFHTSVIVGVDEDGRPVARMTGLGDPAPLVSAMAR